MRSRRADSPSPHPARRDGQSGAIRPAGLAAAIVTAGAVFGLGVLVLPPISPEAPPVPVVAPAPAPPPPPPPVAVVDAATALDAAKADATAAEVSSPKAAAPTPEPAAAPTPTTAEAPAAPVAVDKAKPSADLPKAETAAAHEKSADKDVARDAWRKNLPDISPEPGKSAILIPIKGSTDGSTYHVTAKPKSVLISLPKGESMITMPFYNIRHDGFRQLWIKKDDQTGVTTIRVVLGEATDPQVEIKDEFVRVTVRRPDEAPPAPASAPEPAPTPPASAAHEPPAHD